MQHRHEASGSKSPEAAGAAVAEEEGLDTAGRNRKRKGGHLGGGENISLS